MSNLTRRSLLTTAAAGGLAMGLAACSPAQKENENPGGDPSSSTSGGNAVTGKVTVRLWDEQVQKAYDESFAALADKNPGLEVTTVLVPWADYFTKLRTDVGSGTGDDIFMMNSSYLEPYVTNELVMPIGDDFADLRDGWIEPAIEQYTTDEVLYGVPQLSDGGIGVYYNEELLANAGITSDEVDQLNWGGDSDTYIELAQRLTQDADGNWGDESAFNGSKPAIWGSSAAQDLQGIYYNFLGSAGGDFQDADGRFTFATPEGETAFGYLVDLINKYQVAPAASNTNDNGDFVRDQFLQGKVAMFQSGIYNLKNVADGAKFKWGIAHIPAGTAGRVSVVNNVIVCGNAATKNEAATIEVLRWLGSDEGASYIGKSGAALPAVTGAQQSFSDFWGEQSIDPSIFAEQGREKSIGAPSGANYGAAVAAFKPHFDEMFLGRTPVAEALAAGQEAANKAIED